MAGDDEKKSRPGESVVGDRYIPQVYSGKTDPRRFGKDSGVYRGLQELLKEAKLKKKKINVNSEPGIIEIGLPED
jgi:hypothetical protein